MKQKQNLVLAKDLRPGMMFRIINDPYTEFILSVRHIENVHNFTIELNILIIDQDHPLGFSTRIDHVVKEPDAKLYYDTDWVRIA